MSAHRYFSLIPAGRGGYYLLDSRTPEWKEWFSSASEAWASVDAAYPGVPWL